jgi:hypothetical protein
MVGLEPPEHFVHTAADHASRTGLTPELFRRRRQEFMELLTTKQLQNRVNEQVAVEEDKVRELAEIMSDTKKKPDEIRWDLMELVRRWDVCLEVTVMELELLRSHVADGDSEHDESNPDDILEDDEFDDSREPHTVR